MIGLEYILSVYNKQHIDLAERLGIKKQNINLWIKGKQNIPKKYLPILEELFGVKQECFTKELNEIEKIEIQKEKLKKDLNPAIEKQIIIGKVNDGVELSIYDKEGINTIELTIEKAKLISRFKEAMDVVDNDPYIDTHKLVVELVEKAQDEPLVRTTIEALAHYLKILPDWVATGDKQSEFESKIFKVFDDNSG